MKKLFSKNWIASRQARKQRKYRSKAPLHIKRRMTAAHLSKELRQKYHRRSIALRKEDTVKVMKGKFKGKTGKIMELNTKKGAAYIEGIQRTKKDGTKVNVPTQASNLLVTALALEDKKRIESLERTGKIGNTGGKK